MFNFLLGGIPPEGEKVNAREFCDEQFYRSPHLQNHVKVEQPPPEAQRLPVQGQQFKPQEVPPKCQYCNKTLPAENFHQIQLKLTFRGQIVCIPCQLAFPNFPDLPIMLNPNKAVNSKSQNWKCDYCSEAFDKKYDLNRHKKKSHLQQLEFVCFVCNEKFVELQGLTKHQTVAHGRAEVKCHLCDKVFSAKRNLSNHIATFHEKDTREPHVCPICHKTFILVDYLKTHLKSFHGPKNLKCNHCTKVFSGRSNLCHHVKRMHPNKKVKLETSEDSSNSNMSGKFEKGPEPPTQYHQLTNSTAFPDTWNTQPDKHHHQQHFKTF